jgi:hypothetical protein
MARVGRPPGQTGYRQTDEAKRRMSAEKRLPMEARIARDLEMLDALGRTWSWEFAEYAGVSEQTAKNRLRRLFEWGMADRHKERGRIGWTYKAKGTE